MAIMCGDSDRRWSEFVVYLGSRDRLACFFVARARATLQMEAEELEDEYQMNDELFRDGIISGSFLSGFPWSAVIFVLPYGQKPPNLTV